MLVVAIPSSIIPATTVVIVSAFCFDGTAAFDVILKNVITEIVEIVILCLSAFCEPLWHLCAHTTTRMESSFHVQVG